jgi:hypothetical protein
MLAVAFPRSSAFRSLLPFRNPNRLDHHPLHFFSTHKNFQHKGKLHRAEFQKFHHLLMNSLLAGWFSWDVLQRCRLQGNELKPDL